MIDATLPPPMHYTADTFDALYENSADPWHLRTGWYEERKRALTIACLPHRHFGSVYEPGCANGELSAALATRCDRLLATDGSPKAVALARERLAGMAHVHVEQARMPEDWPAAGFDLIVISELAYYLDLSALDRLCERLLTSLKPGGTLLACHWRWRIEGCALSGDEVHRRIGERTALPALSRTMEADLLIDVWCRDARSIAQREGRV